VSRGHGAIQRYVLDALDRHAALCRTRGTLDGENDYLAVVLLAGEEASRARVEAVRRACRTLRDEGLLELTHLTWNGQTALGARRAVARPGQKAGETVA